VFSKIKIRYYYGNSLYINNYFNHYLQYVINHNYMSLKKSELKEFEKEKQRFISIMELTIKNINLKRLNKFKNLL